MSKNNGFVTIKDSKEVQIGDAAAEHTQGGESHKPIISIPKQMTDRLEAEQAGERRLYLQVGTMEEEAVWIENETEDEIGMPCALRKNLGLIDGLTCTFKLEKNSLRFGPVIGVFVGPTYIRRLFNDQNPKKRTIELLKANEEAHTILYFFTTENVNCKRQKIKGTYFHPHEQRWKQKTFPFPDVLYDRGSGRQRKIPKYRYIRSFFNKHTPMKKINSEHYFDKWELYQNLSKHGEMQPYLPETKLYKKVSDFNAFTKDRKVYIKRCVSSNGRKVMRVVKLPKRGYEYSYYADRVVAGRVRKINDVVKEMNKFFHGKKVILQKAIDLQKVDQSIVDMRANVQRNGRGELEITAISARIGHKNSPVTSTRTGSTCYQFEEFYKDMLGMSAKEVQKLKKKIEQFLITAYTCIEKSYGTFGEIGIDFALDTDGKIWFIEANAKPAKDALYQAYDRETIRKAFQYPLEYAKYISGF